MSVEFNVFFVNGEPVRVLDEEGFVEIGLERIVEVLIGFSAVHDLVSNFADPKSDLVGTLALANFVVCLVLVVDLDERVSDGSELVSDNAWVLLDNSA